MTTENSCDLLTTPSCNQVFDLREEISIEFVDLPVSDPIYPSGFNVSVNYLGPDINAPSVQSYSALVFSRFESAFQITPAFPGVYRIRWRERVGATGGESEYSIQVYVSNPCANSSDLVYALEEQTSVIPAIDFEGLKYRRNILTLDNTISNIGTLTLENTEGRSVVIYSIFPFYNESYLSLNPVDMDFPILLPAGQSLRIPMMGIVDNADQIGLIKTFSTNMAIYTSSEENPVAIIPFQPIQVFPTAADITDLPQEILNGSYRSSPDPRSDIDPREGDDCLPLYSSENPELISLPDPLQAYGGTSWIAD